jgi:succinyl-CoA synthetase beta subunit
MLGQRLGAHVIASAWIEERLVIEDELYLAVAVDRDSGRHVVIASPFGGIDIEEVAPERVLVLGIDPLLGLRDFHAAQIARFLSPIAHIQPAITDAVRALYRVALDEDAELVEVNPLAVVAGGRLVAADAKVVLDDNARFRHPSWSGFTAPDPRSELEQRIADAGAVGIEVDPDGDVTAIVSGAGLMMATLDLLTEAGLRVRCAIDLGGSVLTGGDGFRRVLAALASARPRITFINAFLQTAFCDAFAEGLVAGHAETPLNGRIVVRLKGRRAEQGRRLLAPLGFEIHEDLRPALGALAGTGRA